MPGCLYAEPGTPEEAGNILRLWIYLSILQAAGTMERLLIICEKPSAARNFETALGGQTGSFEGDEYVIINLFGHVLAHETPEKVAYPNHAQTVGPFGCVDHLPWDPAWFDFDKKVVPPQMRASVNPILANIKGYLKAGDRKSVV